MEHLILLIYIDVQKLAQMRNIFMKLVVLIRNAMKNAQMANDVLFN